LEDYDFSELEADTGELAVADGRIIPTIELPRPDERAVADQVIRVIGAAPNLFQRSGSLCKIVRPTPTPDHLLETGGLPSIRDVTATSVREIISDFFRFVRKGKHGEDVHGDCPVWLKSAIHERGEWDCIKPLTGVVTWPAMRTDGTFITKPGYDPGTGLYYFGPEVEMPECPTHEQAIHAVEYLLQPVTEFPFVSPSHVSSWLCLPLTLMARFAIDCTPLWIFDAPTPGSGKTFLAELAVRMVTGGTLPRMTYSSDDEETRKRITSLAMAGATACLVDNVVGDFGNQNFDAAVTATEWEDRVLGANRTVRVPIRVVWMVSGNNVGIKGDMQRRVLHCRLDPGTERPEERTFSRSQSELMGEVDANRTKYLRALMTVLRHAFLSERVEMRQWGSFESWSNICRKAVTLCGLNDPIETRDTFRKASDLFHESRLTLLQTLHRKLIAGEEKELKAGALLGLLRQDEAGSEALCELANKNKPDQVTSRDLAGIFRTLSGRVVGGYKLSARPADKGDQKLWTVLRV
jgi:putative DNA primase/helicase